jgi:DNA-directed DNA polymerase III PolC
VDPIHYQLPFERFLNPDRVTMPDIDVDFEDGRREEVINYVSRKYGADHVAQIITFGTMLAKAAIRDVARVVGMTYGEGDRISKAVPEPARHDLNEAIETSPPLKEMYENEPPVHRVIEFAKQLEGVARNASTHAAGVVISREPLTELMPLQRATNSDAVMTQYEMHAVDALGLLKFDFLGLSNLTILRVAVDLIKAHRGEEIDLEKIPLDDKKTFDLLTTGETTGVFQLESAGMRRYIRELQPSTVFDLAAMVALYRPGPMDNIPSYIKRKHGQEKVTYLHPLLEPYLNRTYGVFVYQEDIMSASTALAGFTGPEADMLGYAIRKKKSKLMSEMREKFVRQAGRARRQAQGHRCRLRRLPALRALRLQQGPRDLLRPDRLPDRVSQGELHGRLHDLRADRFPGQRREGRGGGGRMPAPRHRSPDARRPQVASSNSRSKTTPSASACWRSRTSAKARSNRSSRPAGGRRDFRSSRTSAREWTCGWRTSGSWSR